MSDKSGNDKFPKLRSIRMTGGPGPSNMETRIDGERLDKVARVEVIADASDAVRVITHRYARVDLEVTGVVEDRGYLATISLQGAFGIAATKLAEAEGATLGQAVAEALTLVTAESIAEAEERIDRQLANARAMREGVKLGGDV